MDSRDGQKPGAECVGGVGPGTEPISALGWFSTPLIKDDITWAGNQTRDCDYCKTVMKRFEPLQLSDFLEALVGDLGVGQDKLDDIPQIRFG